MKLIIILIVLLFITNLTYCYNYVVTKQFAELSSGGNYCNEIPYSETYTSTEYCDELILAKTICNENGTISQILFNEKGCKGPITGSTIIPSGNCDGPSYMECVENIKDIPSNSYIMVTTNGACQDDTNWKHKIEVLYYMVLDLCISVTPPIKITCNSTVPVFNVYNSTESCEMGDSTGYEIYKAPICTKEKPTFAYC